METKIIKAIVIVATILIITTLFAEYIISREVNSYIQIAVTGLWIYVTWQLSKMFYKLI